MTFYSLLALVASGVTLHNGLQFAVKKLTAVEKGDARTLVHDAKGVVDFVQTRDPALAKAVEEKYDTLKADAEAEVAKLRHSAAEELRKLAADVEKAVSAVPAPAAPAVPASVSPAPEAPSVPSVS